MSVGLWVDCERRGKTEIAWNKMHVIALDIDVAADAVDYRYIPLRSPPFGRPVHLPSSSAFTNQKSLFGIETEMHTQEGLVKEIVDETRT